MTPTVSPDKPTASAVAVLNVDGMMCAGCVKAVETQLLQCEGVATATVNLVTKAAAVQYEANAAEPENFATVLTEAGFPSELRQGNDLGTWADQQAADQQGQEWRLAIAITLLALSILGHLNHVDSLGGRFNIPILTTLWFHFALATLTLALPARSILQDGWTGIRRARPNMNTLVSIGALSAYLASVVALVLPTLGWECFFDEPVMLLSFILLGRTLEERARFRATSALRGLIALQPSNARLLAGPGKAVDIPIAQIQVEDLLQVLPGDKIPVDGEIDQGQTTVDESMVTGESLLVTKQPRDQVIGGTLNQSGLITIKVQRTGAESTLAQMIQLVEAAQTRKAPIQGLADTLSGYFTYGILTLALLTFLFWYGAGLTIWPDAAQAALNSGHHGHMGHMVTDTSKLLVSLKLAIAVVVIACPCALGLATPMAILVGSGIGAQRGLLVRGGDVLEKLHQLDTIIFDKTGTLTTGKPWVTDCLSYDPTLTEDDVLQLAASVEQGTRHPLADAIVAAAQQRQQPLHEIDNSITEPGLGVSATWQGKTIYLGSDAWLAKANIFTDGADQDVTALAAQGKTLVYVAIDEHLVGVIAVADRPRSEAQLVIQQLKEKHLTVQLLSGDRPDAANRIALDLGISKAKGQMTPADKVQAIEQLQQAGHRVGFVGDGINDAPALAQADVAIAMHSGTEIAMETADIVLMRDELTDILAALDLGRSTFNKIRQNLAWAFGYNLVCIPLAAGVLLPKFGVALSPGFAGGFMAFSSIGVVLNSLLLRWQLRENN
ncbi:MAG: heavy metal translocating P-type ATPase [Cyanobacteria bacterium P01_D01_bin.156]